jgi:hypothetical protein
LLATPPIAPPTVVPNPPAEKTEPDDDDPLLWLLPVAWTMELGV